MEQPKTGIMTEDEYERRVYRRIIYLALVAHSSYIIIFALLSMTFPSVYNIGSVIFYLIMLGVVKRGHYRLTVTAIHFEVCLFVTICVVSTGWETGIQLYLVALSSLVYFCPFRHKYVPYVYAGMQIAVFLFLKFYTLTHGAYYPELPREVCAGLYIYNACACFALILYSAFLSNVSAAVTKKELQRQNKSLAVLANHDQLTGLLSRRPFLKKLEEYRKEPLVLVMGDIDNFKTVNDTYGHVCGDYILCNAASLMEQFCGSTADICRWGGEEFIFLFRGRTLQEVQRLMQGLCGRLAGHEFIFRQETLHITMTFGISGGSMNADPSELIEQADKRMYYGKLHGKNCVIIDDDV